MRVLSFEETARTADLIVVGERTNHSPQERERLEGPAVADIRVFQVLKGSDPGRRIQADAWYGMCDYGMVVDAKPYIMFLARSAQGGFRALNNGCAVKALPIKDQRVELDGKLIPLEEFRKTISSRSTNPSTPCRPNYVLDVRYELIPDRQAHPQDLALIQRFSVDKKCTDGSVVAERWVAKPAPLTTDAAYEKVLHCESANEFVVIKDSGKKAKFYFYKGTPCR